MYVRSRFLLYFVTVTDKWDLIWASLHSRCSVGHTEDCGGKHLTVHLHIIMLSPREGCGHASLHTLDQYAYNYVSTYIATRAEQYIVLIL